MADPVVDTNQGGDNAWKDDAGMTAQFEAFQAWVKNGKRTYDEYQHESLESIRANRIRTEKILSDAQSYDNARQLIANQALQNAVETANFVGKQALNHNALAVDHQWNLEPSQGASEGLVLGAANVTQAIGAGVAEASAAIAAAVVAAVTQALADGSITLKSK